MTYDPKIWLAFKLCIDGQYSMSKACQIVGIYLEDFMHCNPSDYQVISWLDFDGIHMEWVSH